MKVCVNTQTPPVKFRVSYSELLEKYGLLDDPLDLESLDRGVDYDYSPGGVTAMVLPMLEEMSKSGAVSDPRWVCLGVNYPPNVRMGSINVSHVELDEGGLRSYSAFKEVLWSTIHGTGAKPSTKDEYLGYVTYNWVNARKLLEYTANVDVFFIQDFQLLQTGQLIGISAPAVLRWHVPFRPENLGKTGPFVRKALEAFDSVVVSTKRDLEGLTRSYYRGHAYQIYPYIEEGKWKAPTRYAEQALRDKIGLAKDERLLLTVARMDPIKSQDVAIRAVAKVRNQAKVKLLLVGNGSFSSSQSGGLGRDKGTVWKDHLKRVAKTHGVEDRIVFLGYASDDELRAAYRMAAALILPSRIEGFGIAALEGWINARPVVVSRGAGASELVVEGSNGYTFEPGDHDGLAEGILQATGPQGDRLGDNGSETVKQCFVRQAAKNVKVVLEETVKNFHVEPEP